MSCCFNWLDPAKTFPNFYEDIQFFRAACCIQDAILNRWPRLHKRPPWVYNLSLVRSSKVCKRFLLLVVTFYIILNFWEPSPLEVDEGMTTPTWVIWTEFVILLVFWFDFFIRVVESSADRHQDISPYSPRRIFGGVIVLCLTCDWILVVTGDETRYFRSLRALLFIQNRSLWRKTKLLILTLIGAANFFVLMLLFLCSWSIVGLLIFGHYDDKMYHETIDSKIAEPTFLEDGRKCYEQVYEEIPGNFYGFASSVYTMLIMLSTEN